MMFSFGDVHYLDDCRSTLAWPSLYTAMRIQEYIGDFIGDILSKLPKKQPLHMLLRLFPRQARVYFKWKQLSSMSKQEQTSQLKVRQGGAYATNGMGLPAADDDESDRDDAHAPTTGRKRRMRGSASKKSRHKDQSSRKRRKVDSDGSDGESDSEAPSKRGGVRRGGKAAAGGGRKKKAGVDGDSGSDTDGVGLHVSSDESGSSSDAADDDDVGVGGYSSPDVDDVGDGFDAESSGGEEEPDSELTLAQGAAEEDAELHEVEDIIATTNEMIHAKTNTDEKQHQTLAPSAAPSPSASSSSSSTPLAPDGAADSGQVHYEFYLAPLDLYLGPLHRLSHQDSLCSPMSVDHYRTFVKSRESSFVTPTRKLREFIAWSKIPNWIGKNVVLLLGYLAWDRIGMVIECCGRLRDCSRHSRSSLPYTVYEANKAIAFLESDRQTSMRFLKDNQLVGAIKSEMSAYLENRHKHHPAGVGDGSAVDDAPTPGSLIPSASPVVSIHSANATALQYLGAAGGVAAAMADSHATDGNTIRNTISTNLIPNARQNESNVSMASLGATTASGSSFATPAPTYAGSASVAPSAPLSSSPPPVSISALPSSSPSSSHSSSKSGRFSESARVRLQCMADACAWKYRKANPEIQAIHREEGLELDQIRGWMANNKPMEFKRTTQRQTRKQQQQTDITQTDAANTGGTHDMQD